ncbi:chain-length determining protein [Rhizobium sp. Root274]|uniref:exopolysaccharide transport family protein n=1 Tax=unclassified Rhizobium TaxID=2613769 RepID=UPI000715FF68|nr:MULTISPECIES: Wzz/FepE/Etk N-terminal domain-containing protein [unclassified Rhizobium]KQW30916.1 chain-length determining protein [Rhizobium sp. Root1240]KRD32460.1 chain-length determining protein [Rhizobium sp. Root274]
MPSLDRDQQDVDIDLAQFFRAVWQRKGIILTTTALVGVLAFVGAHAIAPTYKSNAMLLIEPREPSFSASGPNASTVEPMPDELNVVSQVQLLQSVDLIKQVARDLNLHERPEFDPESSPSAITDFLVLFGLTKNPLDLPPEERVLKAFKEKLSVYQVEKSRVIGIEFASKDPQLAADVPNAITDVYRSLQSGAKLDSNSEAVRWLETEIANLREKVREAEQKVAEYRSNAGLMSLGSDQSFSSKQLSDISTELARVRGERANAEATAENLKAAIKAGKSTDTIDAVSRSESIQRLRTAESQIQAQISDLSTRLLDGHPQMKSLRAQLAGLREQIRAEALKVAAGLENEAAVARERETQLIAQMNSVKADTARAGEDEVGLKSLEREAAAQRQLLETYLARYREASSRLDKDSSPADARVISRAVPPQEASFPKILPMTIVSALATFILSCVIVMLMELFSGRALRPAAGSYARDHERDVEFEDEDMHAAAEADLADDVAPAAVLAPATSPAVAPAPAKPASLLDLTEETDEAAVDGQETDEDEADPVDAGETADQGEDEFSAASVADYLLEQGTRAAFAISPSGDDGSAGTVTLAREVAGRGRRVVLIDMTGSAWPSQMMTAWADLPGITDLLTGEAAFADCIHPDRSSTADIIPQGNADVRQAMRGADRLSMIVDALADAYDLVLVECGPAEANGLARLSRNGKHEIILSAPEPDARELADIMRAFQEVGYDDLVLMSVRPKVNGPRRRAA